MRAQVSENIALNYSKDDINVNFLQTLNPAQLAEALIKNKNSEKEKFDVICAWVASHIKYDFDSYYSPGGTSQNHLKRTLLFRKGMCLDYATLMDTLCAMAQLTNVTIYGYAKDEIFDVNDSIYIDNHAWNAVRLDGLWYVYDVTWAAGEVEYNYTRFSRAIIKLSDRFANSYKRKKFQKMKLPYAYDCKSTQMPVYYYVPRKFNQFLQHLLWKIPLRVKQSFLQKINANFYLTAPETFAITHFPDNPVWSLLPGVSMRNFEADSDYYHLNESTYNFQNRHGSTCAECDSNVELNPLEKLKYLREQSIRFNQRNHFIATNCEFEIAEIYYKKALLCKDSLSKINNLDTTLQFYTLTKNSLRKSTSDINTDFGLQKSKNRRKQNLLLNDNKKHLAFVRDQVEMTLASHRSIIESSNRSKAGIQKYDNRKDFVLNLETPGVINTNIRVDSKRIIKLSSHLNHTQLQIDSLTALIDNDKKLLDSVSENLSFKIWQKVLNHKTLIRPIIECIQLRKFLKDNFKKPIVETRKQLSQFEKEYSDELEEEVYQPTKHVYQTLDNLLKTIEKRNYLEKDNYTTKLNLCKLNQYTISDLSDYKNFLNAENKEDYCWLKGKFPTLNSINEGFKRLKEEQSYAIEIITKENAIERLRASYINKELLRRKKKDKNIVSHNTSLTRMKFNAANKTKRAFLKQLKNKRKK
ncbi:MAG: hypothetical protein IT236_06320 [Bacteroidia bacterium]|nr:hypothetical protein [Bacteroidia bacterium]